MTGRTTTDERVLDEALAWQQALERDDADWDAYTVWLEADPRHRQAFDQAALTERIVSERAPDLAHLRAIEPPAAVPAPVRHGRRWLAGAVAAALALAIGAPALWMRPADAVYATGRGETRRVALGQGIAVELAPSTRLVARGGDATRLELAQGDAYFAVTHDPGRPLSIQAGGYAVSDIGTTFGVNRARHAVTVSVAEGHVSVTAVDGDATRVSAGQQFVGDGGNTARLGPVQPRDVGSWRQGRLVYSNAPLSVVAADISRYSGKDVTVDSAVGNRQFSGVLAIGDGSGLLADLSDLMGIPYHEDGNRVRIGAAAAH